MADLAINDIEFLEPEGDHGPAKATVHRSGKLGFNQGANKLINFEVNKCFKIGRRRDTDGQVLFLIPVEAKDPLTFEISKTGGYFYLKTRKLLTQMNIDFRGDHDTIAFDIDEMKGNNGEKFYKMTRRRKKPKNDG